MVREHHILNLGAGVQSTTLYLMACDGDPDVPIELAVFADTQEEPEAVYRHLDWLKSLGGPPIHVVTAGKLGDDLQDGKNSTGQRFASIPAFTASREGGREGMVPRQCSREYKIEPIDRFIRSELLGLKPRQRKPKDVRIWRYFGFSFDEQGRAERMRDRFPDSRFPLIDKIMRRADCLRWLEEFGIPHDTPRSACTFCPYRSNEEWRRVKENPEDWQRAVEIDEALRIDGSIVNRGLDQKLYVHRSCRPLKDVNLDDNQLGLFEKECEGGCGL